MSFNFPGLDAPKVALTSTVPVEPLFAAGLVPVDLNNVLVQSNDSLGLVRLGERMGLSSNLCGWVRGLLPLGLSNVYESIVVVDCGDCADLLALGDFWKDAGIDVVYFSFPSDRSQEGMERALERLYGHFDMQVDPEDVRRQLEPLRAKAAVLDELTWKQGQVSGAENHDWLVQTSEFGGDPVGFEKKLDTFLATARQRTPVNLDNVVKVGFLGVPTIFTDLHDTIENLGGRVVYNEVPHQFSFPYPAANLAEQYLKYTYPYGARARLEAIEKQITLRKLDGVILYSENACYKSIHTSYLRSKLTVPMVEIEGRDPGPVDARTRLRLEGFIQMLEELKC